MVEKIMVTLTERTIMKSRSGVYLDTSENRRKHRVGQKYGSEKQPEDGEKTEKKETDPAKELEAVNKVIASINEGKLNLPAAEVMKLSEKKQKLEAAKKQAEKINAGVKAKDESDNLKNGDIVKFVKKNDKGDIINGKIVSVDENKVSFINIDYPNSGTSSFSKESLSKFYNIKKESSNSTGESGEERWKRLVSKMSDSEVERELQSLEELAGHTTDDQERKLKLFLKKELGERKEGKRENGFDDKKPEKGNNEEVSEMKEEGGKTVQPETIGGKWDKSSHEERWKIVGGTGSARLLTRSWGTLPDSARRVIKEKLSAKKESTDEGDEHNLTNEQKAKVTSFSDPKLYSELARNSEEKKDLISTLKNVGEVIKEKESKETGTSGTFKFKNEYIEIVGSEVTTGLKKQKGKSQYLGMSGHKRWYGGGEQFVETEKTEKFSVFDEEKMNNLLSKLNGKKVGGGKIDEKVPSSVKIEQKTFHMKDVKSEPKQGENEESYTRVKFDDVPNSGKVNLKKYLSEKMKKSADEAWGDISKIDTKGLQKMEKGLVEDFNRQFDELPKSRRAEKLYSIMKVKSELEKRGKESQTTETEKKEDEELSLKTFENIAFESKDVYDFMDKVRDIKGVPSSVSEEFRNKYGYENGKPLSVLQASAAFYNKFRNKRSGIDSLKGK